MSDIHYETPDEEVYYIDELSQRILVYLLLHGDTSPEEMVDPTGAESVSVVHSRVSENLGPSAAGLIEEHEFTQNTLTGENEIHQYRLTEIGESFVYRHKSALSMPADLTELAKKVAELRVENSELMDLVDTVDYLEERITELEEQVEMS